MGQLYRHEWYELPPLVRHAVVDECGSAVVDAVRSSAGRNSAFAATLCLATGERVFCKGVPCASGEVRMHRREAVVGPWLPSVAPRLLWQLEVGGWLLLGFEFVDGVHADLTPGSPDLPRIADALSTLSAELTPSPVAEVPTYRDKLRRTNPWSKLSADPPATLDSWTGENVDALAARQAEAIDMIDGDSLQHTDVHELNLLVGGSVHLVDWAWAHTAPPWVDTAFLLIRLIQAGHSPAEAERWARTVDVWHTAAPAALTAFALMVYGMWEHLRHVDPLPVREAPTRAAREWALFRHSTR